MTAAHRYQIIAPLARGGMGEILLARRLGPAGFEKLVVLKRPLHTAGSRALVTALIDEARLLARISHPNVCQIYDLEQAGDQFFFTMEYLEGLSMWSMLGEVPGGIDPRILCGLFEQACDGLEAIHAMRISDGGCIVHRDVSPGNLFVTERGVVKVLDLGIAKSTGSEERTPFGRVKGKLGYLSPEQAAGHPVDHRSDLFSLGLVLHDMVSGRRPKPDRIGVVAAAALDLTAVPRPLADVIRRAIAAHADDRFGSAGEMATALRDAGAAFGGSRSARDIAAWLAQQFGAELERRRAIAAGPGGDTTRTQIWVLRSASAEPDEEDEDEDDDDDDGALAEPAEPPAPPSHHTERLAMPTRERLMPVVERPLSPTDEATQPAVGRHRSPADEATQPEAERLAPPANEAADRATDAAADEATQLEAERPTPEAERLTPAAGELLPPPVGVALAGSPARRRGAALAGAGAAFAIAVGVSVALLVPDGAAGAASPVAAAPMTAPPRAPAPPVATPPVAAPMKSVASPAAREPIATPAAAVSSTDVPAGEPAPPSQTATAPVATPAAPRHKPRRTAETAATGMLTIDSQPFAEIHLGNRDLGPTPLWRIPLPAGRHEFRATTADGRHQDIEFRITPGRERKVMIDWSRP
ncbi:MAG TPA: serine/threonine-protein kinase [Kofleriaceae bacterium]|nr:serine/threonine-protein kinase [Kofleriaceae bacterium]